MDLIAVAFGLGVIIVLVVRMATKAGGQSGHPGKTSRPSAPRPVARPVVRSNPKRNEPGSGHADREPTPAGARFDAETSQPPQTPRQIIKGRAYVVDGDTIRVQKTQIRLFGIDAPEMNHPYGVKAKWAMVKLCKGQDITADVTAMDDHGRTVAKCTLPDGRDLSAELVKQGLAIDWPKYSGGIYRAMETPDARKKMWLADARQKGRMHVWAAFEAQQAAKRANR